MSDAVLNAIFWFLCGIVFTTVVAAISDWVCEKRGGAGPSCKENEPQ